MEVSDWVNTSHNMNKITGFITDTDETSITVFVTIPKNYGVLRIRKTDAWLAGNTVWYDDIPTMIDLALDLKDKEWFDYWTYELSLWTTPEKVFEKKD